MKKMILGLGSLLFMTFAFFNTGCVVAVHDARWHYWHDYNDDYRAHHAWHEERQDWDR
jgi:hypothetical protein